MPSAPTAAQHKALLEAAQTVAQNAYAPYSHFRVGAAILLDNDAIVPGCNVENASFRLTTCAEQAAVAAAVAQHGPRMRIRAIVIQNLNDAPCHPCGACLQTLLEFAAPETTILYPGTPTERLLTDLIPAGFTLDPA